MREIKNAAENQVPKRDHRRKKKKQAPDKVWQEDVDREQRNRSGVNGRRDQIWEGGQKMRGAQGTGRVGWRGRREVNRDSAPLPGPGESGMREFLSPWF